MESLTHGSVMERLREKIPGEEFDYPALMDALRSYRQPRSKATALLKAGSVIRVKKGIYVFGERYRRRPVSREVLANLLYGPSYISLEHALERHGMIPEGVETMTSMSLGRSRRFSTPLGNFTYRRIPLRTFRVGVDRIEPTDGGAFLMALPEKALADKLVQERRSPIRSRKEMRTHLLDDLRMDLDRLRSLDASKLALYADRYRSNKIRLARACVVSFKKGKP